MRPPLLTFAPTPYSTTLNGAHHERRSAPRLPLNEITLWVRGVPYRGRGDISEGGCFWKGERRPELGEQAGISFRIPPLSDEVQVIATVLHERDAANLHAVHLRFDALPRRVQDALRDHADTWFDIADASGLLGL